MKKTFRTTSRPFPLKNGWLRNSLRTLYHLNVRILRSQEKNGVKIMGKIRKTARIRNR